jgi:hypothetical protein
MGLLDGALVGCQYVSCSSGWLDTYVEGTEDLTLVLGTSDGESDGISEDSKNGHVVACARLAERGISIGVGVSVENVAAIDNVGVSDDEGSAPGSIGSDALRSVAVGVSVDIVGFADAEGSGTVETLSAGGRLGNIVGSLVVSSPGGDVDTGC